MEFRKIFIIPFFQSLGGELNTEIVQFELEQLSHWELYALLQLMEEPWDSNQIRRELWGWDL